MFVPRRFLKAQLDGNGCGKLGSVQTLPAISSSKHVKRQIGMGMKDFGRRVSHYHLSHELTLPVSSTLLFVR